MKGEKSKGSDSRLPACLPCLAICKCNAVAISFIRYTFPRDFAAATTKPIFVKLRRSAFHVVLALLLLLSQQLGMAHAVTHLSTNVASGMSSEPASDKHLPGDLHCVQCHAFSSLDSALASQPFAWPVDAPARWFNGYADGKKFLPAAIRAFDSRAPPAIS